MADVKSITLCFNTGERVFIDTNLIGEINIGGIQRQVQRVSPKTIKIVNSTEFVFIELFPDANKNVETYFVDTSEVNDGGINEAQKVYISNHNALYLLINRELKIRDVLSFSHINDEKYKNEMYYIEHYDQIEKELKIKES